MRNGLFAFILSILLISCSQKQNISTEEMRKIVNQNNDKLGVFFVLGNADSLASMYTENAVIAPHGDDFYSGKNAIYEMYKKDVQDAKILQMRTETMTIEGNTEVIYETGKTYLTINYNDSTYDTHVKYCNIWHLQEDGTYKLAVDIWNRDKN